MIFMLINPYTFAGYTLLNSFYLTYRWKGEKMKHTINMHDLKVAFSYGFNKVFIFKYYYEISQMCTLTMQLFTE